MKVFIQSTASLKDYLFIKSHLGFSLKKKSVKNK